MSASGNQNLSLEQIKKLLGAPPVIRGESEAAYWNWWDTFVAQHEPETLTDWLEVDQLAVKHWEQERLKRSNAALVDAAMCKALASLLAVYASNRVIDNPATDPMWFVNPFPIARDYYAGEDLEREIARQTVAAYGITDDQIIAKALELCGGAIVQFDRMDNFRANAKRTLLKELKQRSEARRYEFVISETVQ